MGRVPVLRERRGDRDVDAGGAVRPQAAPVGGSLTAPRVATGFETDRLRAVRLASGHLPAIRVFHEDERMMALIGGTREADWSVDYLAAHARHWEEHGFGFYLLHDRVTGEAIGLGGLRTMDLDGTTELEVGYAFLPEWWGKGLATEATTAFLGVAAALVEFSSVVAVIDPRNAASIRVATRLGFALERTIQHELGERLIYRR